MTGILSEAEITRIVGRIARLTDPDSVLIFGSYAKGRAEIRSDLDLLVVMPNGPLRWRPCDLEPLTSGSIIPVDVHIVTSEELTEYGAVRHHFLHSVLTTARTAYRRT
ncbi:nucleotidyltransferase domain-containing protein [Actinoplanes sp. NBRC 103695]|uniref:nucleotidyltransferase domain-containing protein n=1 Tax=Actinoplanes sp. NBRC 103695 TaxID=3032202 RepID=UPI0024A2BE35|nr:nucleotidyltransferase domain-containing protein [Actinoplanes sp. NBRC 103695]GLY94447.1 hypothetical protein Acsp02_17030 [Actinoplanes sp. NBRC 103695]